MSDTPTPVFHVTSSLISASAGTGKTYQLASRFIALLMLGVAPEKIIALTFTKKAAGEFRNRILQALAEGACNILEKSTKRNVMAARVWAAWSGLSCDLSSGTWHVSGTPLLPASIPIVKRAIAERLYPEQLYAEDAELRAYLAVPELTAETFSRKLAQLARSLSKLTLTTLDSFFNTLVTGNSLELGLNNVSALDPEKEPLKRRSAIRAYLEGRSSDEAERNTFLRRFSELTEGRSKRTIAHLESQMEQYLGLYRKYDSADAWGNLGAFARAADAELSALDDEASALWEHKAREMRNLLRRFTEEDFPAKVYSGLCHLADRELPLSSYAKKWIENTGNFGLLNKTVQQAKLLMRAFDGEEVPAAELAAAMEEAPVGLECTGWTKANGDALTAIVTKLRSGNCKETKAITAFRTFIGVQNILTEVQIQMCGELHALAEHLSSRLAAKLLHDVSAHTRSLFSLLRDYADTYEQQMEHDGELTFDDISRKAGELMQQLTQGDDTPGRGCREHIALRTGRDYQHWMLDEFQDTSDDQFATLEPVLSVIAEDAYEGSRLFTVDAPRPLPRSLWPYHEDGEYCVGEGSLFVVGDDKQGIYGFRTGDSRAFQLLRASAPWHPVLGQTDLVKSYRSSPVIMGPDGFVNTLFRALNETEKADVDAYAVNLEPFTHHETALSVPGYAEIRVLPSPEGASSADDTAASYCAVSNVLKTLTTDGKTPVKGISIAVLTRSNREADAVVNHLSETMPELPVLLVKDTPSATANPLGELLRHFFLWQLHPHQELSEAVLRTSYLGSLFAERESAEVWAEWRRTIEEEGYSNVLRRLLAPLTKEQRREQKEIIATWLTAARAFDAEGGSPEDWVLRISTLSTQGVAASRYVQVMTMHKSKGLEFDAVILPFLSAKAIDNTADHDYFCTEDASGILLSPGDERTREQYWPHVFERAENEWKRAHSREAYNLLYVATTRARYANYILLNGSKLTRGFARSESGLMRRALGGENIDSPAYEEEKELIPPMGEKDWYLSDAIKDKSAADRRTEDTEVSRLGAAVLRRSRLSPSSAAKEDKGSNDEDEASRTGKRFRNSFGGTRFGTMTHACFEEILTLQSPLPAWLAQTSTDTPAADERTRARQVVAAALQQDEVRALFTARARQEVFNEQPIEAIPDIGVWVSGTIDRLILTFDERGEVTAAHIIDFKTNRLRPTKEEQDVYRVLTEEYKGQMREYHKLISKAYELPPDAVTVSLISVPKDYREHPARVLTYASEEFSIPQGD